MNTTTTISLPVNLLWNFREFNRMTNPAPQFAFVMRHSLPEIASDIEKNGLKNPIHLSIYADRALVTDGNHRLTIYKMSGKEMIDVQVTYYDEDTANSTFLPHTLGRFRRINPSLINSAA